MVNRSQKPLVSVIVPVYNALPYLYEALESLSNQTLNDIEFICVNDGSTDDSLAVLEKYASRDGRFTVLTGPNGGYGKAMNKGMMYASGAYVGIVEPDDYVEKTMYQELVGIALRDDADIVRGRARTFYGSSNERRFFDAPPIDKSKKSSPIDLTKGRFPTGVLFQTWTGIYRRSLIEKRLPIYHETPGAMFQDSGFWFNLYATAKTYSYTDKYCYYYRRDNAGSSTSITAVSDRKALGILREFELTRNDLSELTLVNASVLNIFWIQFCQAVYSSLWLSENEDGRKRALERAEEIIEDERSKPLLEKCDSNAVRMLTKLVSHHPHVFSVICRIVSRAQHGLERRKLV